MDWKVVEDRTGLRTLELVAEFEVSFTALEDLFTFIAEDY